jgi:hypothetical protein
MLAAQIGFRKSKALLKKNYLPVISVLFGAEGG